MTNDLTNSKHLDFVWSGCILKLSFFKKFVKNETNFKTFVMSILKCNQMY